MSFTLSKELEELQKVLQNNIDLKMRLAQVDALLNCFHSEKNPKTSTKKEIKKPDKHHTMVSRNDSEQC